VSRVVVDGLRWEVRARGTGRPLLLIHGFTGRGTSWGPHADAFAGSFRTIVVDLPGHGRSAVPSDARRASVECSADDVATILRRLEAAPASVIGYSLGARIALRLAVAHPGVVDRLVLESPSAGIADRRARAERQGADDALADRIERDGIPAFVADWEAQPIFASQVALPPGSASRIRRIRLANRPEGLAVSLRAAGQGAMVPLFDRLGEVRAETLVIAGSLDIHARPRIDQVAAAIPGARMAVIDGSGHTPHDEQPLAFRRLALDFLQEDAA
jgi:2-succinyl-6-hydroxy-2,4-cyclohexadiene-1-carboxylate synthase